MDTFDIVKDELDKELATVDVNVGVAFGEELFAEFRRRGWLTLETFGVLGTSIFPTQVPAYNKTHFAFLSWSIESLAFKVGRASK